RSYPMTAIYRDTPSEPHGPWVLPGTYTLVLRAGDTEYPSQNLRVAIDPRVQAPWEALNQQFIYSMRCYSGTGQARAPITEIRKLRNQIKERRDKAGDGALADALSALDQKAAALEGRERGRRERGMRDNQPPSFARAAGEQLHLLGVLQSADAMPTRQAFLAVDEAGRALEGLFTQWNELKSNDVKAVNERLRAAKQTPLALD